MTNKLSKNLQKTSESGLITASSIVITYLLCHYLKWDFTYLSPFLVIVIAAILGGIYNLIKHVPINWDAFTTRI